MLDDVDEEFYPDLCTKVENELGIPGCNILVNASHTHPPGRLLCDDDQQIERTFDAVKRAVQNMTEVRIGTGAGYEDGITMNRTLKLKNGTEWSLRHTNPSPPDDEVAGLGPIDPEIGIVRIDRIDGRPLAVVYSFACHPLFGDAKGSITANFPGVASRVIEESLGHGAMALFLQGTGGNVIDINFKNFFEPRDIESIGTKLAVSTLKAFQEIDTSETTLNGITETIDLPRRTDIPDRISELEIERAELLESLIGTTLNFKTFLPLYIKYSCASEFPVEYASRYLKSKGIGSEDLMEMDSLNRKMVQKYLKSVSTMEKLANPGQDCDFEKAQADKR